MHPHVRLSAGHSETWRARRCCRGVPETSSERRLSGASSAVDNDASHGSFGIITRAPARSLGGDASRKRRLSGGEDGSLGAEHGLPRHPNAYTSRQARIS